MKEQNPGFDLLLAADWEALLAAQNAGIPHLPTMAELTKAAPVTVSASSPPAESRHEARSENAAMPTKTVPIAIALGVAALLVSLPALRREK